MNFAIEFISGEYITTLDGRLDTVSSPQVEQEMVPLMENADCTIHMECKSLAYISSSGLRLFIMLQKEVNRRGGKLIVHNLAEDIREIFDQTGFSSIFTIV